jgi:hypothetical protein
MVDIDKILAGMVTAIQSRNFPNGSEIASTLGLDLSKATTTTTNGGVVAIIGARLQSLLTAEVGVAGGSMPHKTLDFVFFNSTIPVGSYFEAATRDSDQRIEPSKHGRGLAIAFGIDGFDCGFTASAPDGVVETLFCAAKPAGSTTA